MLTKINLQLIKTFQILAYWPARLLSSKPTSGLEKLIYVGGPVLIASNHSSSADPFSVITSMPFKLFIKLAPYKFMTADKWYYRFLIPAWLSGCFPTKNILGKKTKRTGVEGAIRLMASGASVDICPEGKRLPVGTKAVAHSGVSRIYEATKRPLILAHIRHAEPNNSITYQLSELPHSTQAQTILNAIYSLGK
jgi:1-acyl-sn-glycerol-3-phosphate acyltransferase